MSPKESDEPVPYIMVRLILVSVIATPILTGLFTALAIKFLVNNADHNSSQANFYFDAYSSWGYTIFFFTWPIFLLVLAPYAIVCYNYSFIRNRKVLKLIFFLFLFISLGVLLPDASILKLILPHPYPYILPVYLLLTFSITPFLDYIIKKTHP